MTTIDDAAAPAQEAPPPVREPITPLMSAMTRQLADLVDRIQAGAVQPLEVATALDLMVRSARERGTP